MKNFTWSWDEPEEMVEDELDMQAIDEQLDPDGLDRLGQQLWNDLQREKLGYADKDIFVEGDDQEFLVEF